MSKNQPKDKDKKEPQTQGVFYSIMSFFRRKDPRKPVKGWMPRIKNILRCHYRGLLGLLVPICALSWQGEKGVNHITVQCMWMLMFWFFLLQPVSIPVTGLIPIFLLPMTGVLPTGHVTDAYMGENLALFILTSMLILLMNNSGVDRRIALWLICSGDNCQFSGKRLVFKCSTASFFLSMFSNRLIVTSTITQYITPALTNLQASTARNRATEPDYNEMRYIINNAIQTASSIGSTAIMHSAYATLCFRAIFVESAPKDKVYPDIFNYMQYSAYAFPTAFLMYIINFSYHMILINKCVRKSMSAGSMTELRNALLKIKNTLPRRVTLHEKLTVFFTIFALVIFFFRWSAFLNMGWAEYNYETPQLPRVKDATVAAIFVVAMHVLPRSYGFLKYFSAEKRSELPPLRPESAILFWRFVDKNVNYGYIFLIGSGICLERAVKSTGLDNDIADHFGKVFTDHAFSGSLFLVCLVAIILSNVMSGVAACVIFLPLILSMAQPPGGPVSMRRAFDYGGLTTTKISGGGDIDDITYAGFTPYAKDVDATNAGFAEDQLTFRSIGDWPTKMYQGALGVGLASSFGFMFPFLYTPAYFCHYTGKVPIRRMAKYSIGSVIICLIILWLSVMYYAPVIWDLEGKGITAVDMPSAGAPAAGGAPPAAGGGDAGNATSL